MTLLKSYSRFGAVLLATLLFAGVAAAQTAVVDYVGFAWETGGLSDSFPGDELSIATVVTQIDPLFDVDLGTVEGTVYIDGLISTGSIYNSTLDAMVTSYVGGTLRIYADAGNDHDWGVNPANGTVPSTFINGYLVFEGSFTDFVVTMPASGAGVYEGLLDATGGVALVSPCSGCAYTFAGAFTPGTGANIPAGYDLQIDGVLEVESTVPNEDLSWGMIKQLYR